MSSSFVIYRIIGNSLPPRHGENDSYDLLKFILENEPPLKSCQKRWILNRLTNPELEQKCIELINSYQQEVHVIPFNQKSFQSCFRDASGMPKNMNPFILRNSDKPELYNYRSLEWILRHKSQHLININHARNTAIELGKNDAEWVLPLDGWCYFTHQAWQEFIDTVSTHKDLLYGIIPIERINDNSLLLKNTEKPNADEEPQIAFHHTAPDRFNEHLRYGNLNKAELLTRLGVPGIWNNWSLAKWDTTPMSKPIKNALFIVCSWTFRLSSGTHKDVELDDNSRFKARFEGVENVINQLEADNLKKLPYKKIKVLQLLNSHKSLLQKNSILELEELADSILNRPIPKVTDKTELPPSGQVNDYISPARYLHEIEGVSVMLDGTSNPKSVIGSVESRRYDRTSLYEFIHQTTVLTTAGIRFRRQDFLHKAAELLITWFINPISKMNPHTKYAQYKKDKPDLANPSGIIDFRDFWIIPFLCNKLLAQDALSRTQYKEIKVWFRDFQKHLIHSKQGKQAYQKTNNIGTWTHLLKTSLSLFLGNHRVAAKLLGDSSIRLVSQCLTLGIQNEELSRTLPLHYSLFNLTAWVLYSNLANSVGCNLWGYKGLEGQSLCRMLHFIQVNLSSFSEFHDQKSTFLPWLDALVFLTPQSASDYHLLKVPEQHIWTDDPNNGLPSQWVYLLGII